MKVVIITTHLLGTGHLSRALSLGQGFRQCGQDVWVISGGRPAPHLSAQDIHLIQLPPVHSDGLNFTSLLTAEDRPVDEAYRVGRQAKLLTALADIEPDVVMTELYPFGRRVLRDEFDAVLQHQRARKQRPLILSSVRDILAPPSSEPRAKWTEEQLTSAYDAVLVHADPAVVQLGDSWPITAQIAELTHYTGFVAPPLPSASADGPGTNEILVAAGGGPVGQRLFETVIEASQKAGKELGPIRLLVGGDPNRREALSKAAQSMPWIAVEAPRPDYREMLQRAALSISQAGYNTMLDVAMAGVRALIIPFAEGGESEQTDRAHAYQNRLGFDVLAEAALTADTLLAAINRAMNKPQLPPVDLQVTGAIESARITETLLREMRSKSR